MSKFTEKMSRWRKFRPRENGQMEHQLKHFSKVAFRKPRNHEFLRPKKNGTSTRWKLTGEKVLVTQKGRKRGVGV